MLEDYKNFPKVPELGEETARYIRQEMEDTWGSEHLSVLPEDEAQHWILGVSILFFFLRTSITSPFKICKYFKDILHQYLNTIYKQVKLSFLPDCVLIIESISSQQLVCLSQHWRVPLKSGCSPFVCFNCQLT